MKELEQKASELVDKFYNIQIELLEKTNEVAIIDTEMQIAKYSAIQSVNYTIEVLRYYDDYTIDKSLIKFAITEQIELKKILEGRL